MAVTEATAEQILRSRLDTVATGSQWGTELIDYLSRAQRQLVADLPDIMFTDGQLSGSNVCHSSAEPTPSGNVQACVRAGDSLRVLYVLHNDGTTTRAAQKQDSADKIYNRAANDHHSSVASGGAFYALSTNTIVVWPSASGYTVTEYYLKIPTALTASGSFQIPDWLVDTCITYALYLALSQVGKGNEAGAAMEEYKTSVAGWYKSFKLEPPPRFLSSPKVESN